MRPELRSTLRPAFALVVAFTLLTGLLYPVVVWIVTHDVFAYEAEGSLVRRAGHVVGSERVGQSFTSPRYLWGRPSAAAPGTSGGSNLGPLHPALIDSVRARIAALRATGVEGPIPVDLVTASASGLDPHVSPAAARVQAARIARARGVDVAAVRAVIERHVERPTFFVLGEPRVNVLAVNLDLDRAFPTGVVY
jgi:K+-transporting ATPase ATPase C chain